MQSSGSLAPTPIIEPTELAATGTVLLWTKKGRGKFTDSGTGFFYRNGSARFLVTARHVVYDGKDEDRPDTIRFRVKTNPENLGESRDIELPLWQKDRPLFRWSENPIDLAAIPVLPETLAGAYVNDFVDEFSPPLDVVIPLGADLILVGFPKGLYDEANNLPLARRGSLASVYRAHFNRRPVFKIDARLGSEMSGSPVLMLPSPVIIGRKNRFELRAGLVSFFLGVHVQGFDDEELHEAYYPDLVKSLTRATP